MSHKVQLLSTVLLDQRFIDKVADMGIELDVIPFIHVSTVIDKKLQEEIVLLYEQPLTVVFTSANAVQALRCNSYNKQPHWNIYCIGNATKNAILEYFDAASIKGTANNATMLAALIKDKGIKEVVFFCGDKRMDTLPLSLQQVGIMVKEIVVYETEETSRKTIKEYDGILFFSPSGVNSFFSLNSVPAHTVLFAIGNTTANAIKEQTHNLIMVSENPSKEFLIEDAINYFHKKAIAAQEQKQ